MKPLIETAFLAKAVGYKRIEGGPIIRSNSKNSRTGEKNYKIYFTLYDLQKWLREEHGIDVLVGSLTQTYLVNIYTHNRANCIKCYGKFMNFEEALESGIIRALNYLKTL